MSSTTNSSPLPPKEHAVAVTRQSCAEAAAATGLTPNLAAIDAFLRSLDQPTFERLRTQHGLNLPLRFPTPTAELNFLGILALLNALSGYRTAFHKATGSGAYQNVTRLMIGLYIAGSGEAEDRVVASQALTAKGMRDLTEAKLVELLGVSVHEEKPHESLPGVTVGVRGGEMLDAVQLVLKTVQNVGKTLIAKNYASLGAFLVHLMKQAKDNNLDDTAATDFMVYQIASTLPEFCDTHTLASGQNVLLFKRIFFLLHSLHLRFGDRQEWTIPNTYKTLPMFVDNVLPTLCVWFNLLCHPPPASAPENFKSLYDWVANANCNADLPRNQLASLPKNAPGPTLSKDETYAIRAATLHLGHIVCQRAHELAQNEQDLHWLHALNQVDLDGYLWAVAKDDEALRKVPRFVFPSIHF